MMDKIGSEFRHDEGDSSPGDFVEAHLVGQANSRAAGFTDLARFVDGQRQMRGHVFTSSA